VTVRRRLAAFALALAGAFGVGAVVGNVAGPIDVDAESDEQHQPTADRPADRNEVPADHGTEGGHG
jgi:hypothetical protein